MISKKEFLTGIVGRKGKQQRLQYINFVQPVNIKKNKRTVIFLILKY